jgi:hypothetical protein
VAVKTSHGVYSVRREGNVFGQVLQFGLIVGLLQESFYTTTIQFNRFVHAVRNRVLPQASAHAVLLDNNWIQLARHHAVNKFHHPLSKLLRVNETTDNHGIKLTPPHPVHVQCTFSF